MGRVWLLLPTSPQKFCPHPPRLSLWIREADQDHLGSAFWGDKSPTPLICSFLIPPGLIQVDTCTPSVFVRFTWQHTALHRLLHPYSHHWLYRLTHHILVYYSFFFVQEIIITCSYLRRSLHICHCSWARLWHMIVKASNTPYCNKIGVYYKYHLINYITVFCSTVLNARRFL